MPEIYTFVSGGSIISNLNLQNKRTTMVDIWDQRYAVENYVYGKEPNEWFVEKLKIFKPGKLLLPAEGEGRNAVWAASNGWNVTAFDHSTEAKAKALKLAVDRGVKFEYLIKDLRCFRAEEHSFDAIGLIYVHMPSSFRKDVHEDLIKLLKPGGCLVFEAFTKSQLNHKSGGPSDPDMLYEPEEIREDFNALKILEFHSIKLHLHEGELHKGIADVVRIFARKIS
jgi:SAM-dependent methyltransferase